MVHFGPRNGLFRKPVRGLLNHDKTQASVYQRLIKSPYFRDISRKIFSLLGFTRFFRDFRGEYLTSAASVFRFFICRFCAARYVRLSSRAAPGVLPSYDFPFSCFCHNTPQTAFSARSIAFLWPYDSLFSKQTLNKDRFPLFPEKNRRKACVVS